MLFKADLFIYFYWYEYTQWEIDKKNTAVLVQMLVTINVHTIELFERKKKILNILFNLPWK